MISYAVLLFSGNIPSILSIYNYTQYTARVIDHISVLAILALYGYSYVLGDAYSFSYLRGVMLVIFTFILVSVQDRAALLSFASVNIIGFFLIFPGRLKKKYLAYLVPVGLFLLFLSDIVLARFVGHDVASEVNLLMRYDAWRAALRMFLDHPLFGIGLGMWENYIPMYSARLFNQFTVYPHHFFLHYLSAGGIFVAICLAAIYIKIFIKAFNNQLHLRDKQLISFNSGLLMAILSFFIYGLIGGNHSAFTFITSDRAGTVTGRAIYAGMLFWTSVGLLFSLERGDKTP
jgi:O-antigen ligase